MTKLETAASKQRFVILGDLKPIETGHSSFVISSVRLLTYLQRLDRARIILWCYAIWYVVVLVHYFDPAPRIWLTSLGLSLIIGCALLLSTRAASSGATQNRWGVFRLFLMPFCVSSFSALVKGRDFFLIFSPRIGETLVAAALCAGFCATVALLKRLRPGKAPVKT